MKPSYPYRGQVSAPLKPPIEPQIELKPEPKAEPIELTPVELAPIAHKVGDRVQYVGKEDQRYGSEPIRGKILTVVTVHAGYLSADTPPMGFRSDGYRTTWIDFKDVAAIDIPTVLSE